MLMARLEVCIIKRAQLFGALLLLAFERHAIPAM